MIAAQEQPVMLIILTIGYRALRCARMRQCRTSDRPLRRRRRLASAPVRELHCAHDRSEKRRRRGRPRSLARVPSDRTVVNRLKQFTEASLRVLARVNSELLGARCKESRSLDSRRRLRKLQITLRDRKLAISFSS
jgi:hypothetical protein